jgi:hypothetical protein
MAVGKFLTVRLRITGDDNRPEPSAPAPRAGSRELALHPDPGDVFNSILKHTNSQGSESAIATMRSVNLRVAVGQ